MTGDKRPLPLAPARAWRTYVGGSQIDRIHGIQDGRDTQFPEEWIMSTVVARNAGREAFASEGLSFLKGRALSLRDYIAQNPAAALGAAHVRGAGETTGVLVKIIDAGERLTIQAHPNRQRAMELFHSPFGKTECWHILGGREINGEKPCVYMGFREGVTREEFKRIFRAQDIPAMLGCLHRFEAKPGETYLIGGGVPHAIGAGCLLIEIQEPTDYTIRTERTTPAGLRIADFMCHQGLGFDRMFDCFDFGGVSRERARDKWRIPPALAARGDGWACWEIIGYRQTPCFRLERYDIGGRCPMRGGEPFSGLYVLGGRGRVCAAGGEMAFRAGDQFFVPASSENFDIAADAPATVFRCYGPKNG